MATLKMYIQMLLYRPSRLYFGIYILCVYLYICNDNSYLKKLRNKSREFEGELRGEESERKNLRGEESERKNGK